MSFPPKSVAPASASGQRAIRYVLDGELRSAADVAPTRTVLQHLREDLGRTGTKEGCAEGDCGACTVVVAESHNGGLLCRAINACIQFLPTLDGKALFTVESLKSRDGALHPVQQAMVDCHGSQCGFCTPGFVMSMFALYKTQPAPGRAQIDDALAGNLCRCTGYRPIVDAAGAMYARGADLPDADADWVRASCGRDTPAARAQERQLADQLAAIARDSGFEYEHAGVRFWAPRSIDELARLRLEHPRARLLAGGTDVGLWVTKQYRDLGDIIYLGEVAEMKALRTDATHLEIGAAATLTDAFPAIVALYPDLEEVARRFASPPIRNAGTLAGNVANGSPIGDSMPCLIALGASIVLRKGAGAREMPLQDFYLGYQKNALAEGEFLQSVRLPLPRPTQLFRAYKISKRFDQDISAVLAAFAIELDGGTVKAARVAFGGMAATPSRAPGCERALAGREWNTATVEAGIAALAADFTPISDMRASADYRRLVAGNLLRRFHLETAGEADPARTPVRLHGLGALA